MPRYLIVAKYTAEGVKGVLSKGGTARRDAVTTMVEQLGGRVETFDFAFGDDDVFVVVEAPDNISVASFGLAIGASGLTSVRTIVLLTPEEIDAAAELNPYYHGPGQ